MSRDGTESLHPVRVSDFGATGDERLLLPGMSVCFPFSKEAWGELSLAAVFSSIFGAGSPLGFGGGCSGRWLSATYKKCN